MRSRGAGGFGVVKVATRWASDFQDHSRIFAPFATLRHGFEESSDWPDLSAYNALARRRQVANARGMPLTFVAQELKPGRRRRRTAPKPVPYEQVIYERAEVPTRPASWHDFFNMLAW